MKKKCGNCLNYKPEKLEIGSGSCDELIKVVNPENVNHISLSVLATDFDCDGNLWVLGKRDIITCPICGEGCVDIKEEVVLGGKPESWINFFDVLKHTENNIKGYGDGSLGNFWAFVHHLEKRFSAINNGNDKV